MPIIKEHKMNAIQFNESFEEAKLVKEEVTKIVMEYIHHGDRAKYQYFQQLKQIYIQTLDEGKERYIIEVYKIWPKDRSENYRIKCRFINDDTIVLDLLTLADKKPEIAKKLLQATKKYRAAFFEMIKQKKAKQANLPTSLT